MTLVLSEADLLSQVTYLATICGWGYVHFRPAQTQRGWRTPVQGPLGKGWPDLVLVRVRDGRILAVELKRDGQQPTAEQAAVLAALEAAGVETAVWRPADWDSIVAALS